MLIWLKNQRKVRYRTFQLRPRLPTGAAGTWDCREGERAEWIKNNRDIEVTEVKIRVRVLDHENNITMAPTTSQSAHDGQSVALFWNGEDRTVQFAVDGVMLDLTVQVPPGHYYTKKRLTLS